MIKTMPVKTATAMCHTIILTLWPNLELVGAPQPKWPMIILDRPILFVTDNLQTSHFPQ